MKTIVGTSRLEQAIRNGFDKIRIHGQDPQVDEGFAAWVARPIISELCEPSQPLRARWVERPYRVEGAESTNLIRAVVAIGHSLLELSSIHYGDEIGGVTVVRSGLQISAAPNTGDGVNPFSYEDDAKDGIPRLSISCVVPAMDNASGYESSLFWTTSEGHNIVRIPLPFDRLERAFWHLSNAAWEDVTETAQLHAFSPASDMGELRLGSLRKTSDISEA